MPEKIQKGIGYTGISQLLSMGLKFATSIILARGLGDAGFGLYNVFQSGIETMSWILDFGGNSTVTKFIADADADEDPKKSFSALSSTLIWHGLLIIVFWLVLLIFSKQIVTLWFDQDFVLLVLFAIAVPLAVLSGDFIGALYGLRELKYVAVRMVTQQGLVAAASLVLVYWLGLGVRTGAFILTGVWFILTLGLLQVLLRLLKQGRVTIHHQFVFKQVLLYSMPIGGVYVIETLIRYAPVLLVKAFNQGDAGVNETVASVALAVFFASVAEGVIQFLIRSGYGYLGRWHHLKLNHLFVGYLLAVSGLTFILFILVYIVFKFGLPVFVSVVYGPDFLDVQKYVFLTLLASLFRSLTYIYRVSLYVMESTLKVFFTSLVELVLYILSVLMILQIESAPDWGTRFLQIAAFTSAIRVVLLLFTALITFRKIEKRSIITLTNEAISIGKQQLKKFTDRNHN